MRYFIAASFLCPLLLAAQETVRPQGSSSALSEWRRQQLAIAESIAAERQAHRKKDAEALVDLEEKMNRVRTAMRNVSMREQTITPGQSRKDRFAIGGVPRYSYDPQRLLFDPQRLAEGHQYRLARLAEDDSSAASVLAVYRGGDPEQVGMVLAARIRITDQMQAYSVKLADDAKDYAMRAEEWRRWALLRNTPNEEAEIRKQLRVEIEQAGRVMHYFRAVGQFELRQRNLLGAERISLDQQLSAASALRRP